MGVVLRQACSESQRTVLMRYFTISTNVRHYQTYYRLMTSFLSGRQHYACNTVQLLQRSRLSK